MTYGRQSSGAVGFYKRYLLILCIVIFALLLLSVPASAGSITIDSVTTTKGDQSADKLAPGQTIEVEVSYSDLSGADVIGIYDKDQFSTHDQVSEYIYEANGNGQLSFKVPYSEVDSALEDDGGDRIEFTAIYHDNTKFWISEYESDTKKIGTADTTMYLKDVPDSATEGESVSATIYGWTTYNPPSVDWELRDPDLIGGEKIDAGSAFVGESNYYDYPVFFTPSEYTGGIYDPPVDVKAVHQEGSAASEKYQIDIEDNTPPTASDVYITTDEDTPVTDSFDATDPDGNSLTYSVETGGGDHGGVESGTEPGDDSFTYIPHPGYSGDDSFTYEVSDGNGGTDSATVFVTVNEVNEDPSVSLSGVSVQEGGSTTLNANANDPDGDSLSYDWSMNGPGSLSSNGKSATYDAPSDISSDKSATVEVQVDDGNGGSDSASATINVNNNEGNDDDDGDGIPNSKDDCPNEPGDDDGYKDNGCRENPKPSVSLSGASVSEGGSTTLTANANDPEGDNLGYSWSVTSGPGSVSGGSSATYNAPSGISSDKSATVSVTVTEPDGSKTAQDSATVTVSNDGGNDDDDGDGIPNSEDECPNQAEDKDGYQDNDGCPENPEPSVSLSDASVQEGGTTTLTADASDPEGDGLSYEWSAYEGSISGSGSSVTYNAPSGISSEKRVDVTVTAIEPDDQKSSQGTATVTVTKEAVPANFDVSIDSTNSPVTEGETLRIEATVRNTGDESGTQTIEANVPGVGSDTQRVDGLAGGSSRGVEFNMPTSTGDADEYTAEVSSQDDTATQQVTVSSEQEDQPVEASFTYSPTSPSTSERVSFDASSSSGNIQSYEWEFGEGTTATGETVSHTYGTSRDYTVTLTVTGDNGETDTTTKTVLVESDDGETGGGVIGEVGKLTPNQPDQSTWFTADLQNSYDDPVVIMKPVGTSGDQAAHIRLKNVQSDSFEYKVEEWSHTNDGHAEVDVYYLVVESGTHEFTDGTTIEAGTKQINHEFSTISLSGGYSGTPVAFTQSQTYNGGTQIVTRNRNVDSNSIETRLQEEEGADGEHAYETVGYVSVEEETGSNDGVSFEVGRTADNVVSHSPHEIEFSQSFGSEPAFVADMQTFNGRDTAEVRMESLDSRSASVYIEEEKTGDTETNHGNRETVGYLAIEQTGTLGSSDAPSCEPGDANGDGRVTSGDATLVERHVVGFQADIDTECADINDDGRVTTGDATLILRKVVGLE